MVFFILMDILLISWYIYEIVKKKQDDYTYSFIIVNFIVTSWLLVLSINHRGEGVDGAFYVLYALSYLYVIPLFSFIGWGVVSSVTQMIKNKKH